jgi:hypothetical protein
MHHVCYRLHTNQAIDAWSTETRVDRTSARPGYTMPRRCQESRSSES